MSFSFVARFSYQWILFFGSVILISLMTCREIVLSENRETFDQHTLVITQNWPGKTTNQVEESLTKPWEMILKSVSGYLELKSVSEFGSVSLHLKLSEGIQKEEFIQTIRNLYILNQNLFPKGVLFPRFIFDSGNDSNFILLRRISKNKVPSPDEFLRKIQNLTDVKKITYQPESETEIQIKVDHNRILNGVTPSLSEIYDSLRHHLDSVTYDPRQDQYFVNEYSVEPSDWEKVLILNQRNVYLPLGKIASTSITKVYGKNHTRINGSSFESILIFANNPFQLIQLSFLLHSILLEFPDWQIVFSSQEEFLDNIKVIFYFYLVIEVFYFLYFGILRRQWISNIIHIFSFILFLVLLFFSFRCLKIPIGYSGFVFLLLLKVILPFMNFRRIIVHKKQLFSASIIFLIAVYSQLVPISILNLVLIFLFALVLYPILSYLFFIFWRLVGKRNLSFRDMQIQKLNELILKKELTRFNTVSVLSLSILFLTFLYSLPALFNHVSSKPQLDNVKLARLEFPSYVAESERNRITRQVEESILQKQLTNLLVVTHKNVRSDFYMKFNEGVHSLQFKNLPSEMGYFHFLEEIDGFEPTILRFTNKDPKLLESSVLKIIPWIQIQKKVTEVILGFQPSTEGIEFKADANHLTQMSVDLDPTIRETNLLLQPNVVSKMLYSGKLVDVKLIADHSISKENFKKQPIVVGNGQIQYPESLRQYSTHQNLGKIFHKNAETSMEIFVKGENINWISIEDGIHTLLAKDETQLVERTETNDGTKKYRFIFLLSFLMPFFFRKKYRIDFLSFVFAFVILCKWQTQFFTRNYDQLCFIPFLFVFFRMNSRKKIILPFYLTLPYIGLLFGSYFYPWKSGVYLFQSMFLFQVFGIIFDKSKNNLKIFRTR
ncbi:AcrB/AcrD/AcrF family protein [Leptospira limi]|uniref:AcrB/AcrD/AcrF family protein n=1 Tax=Leptospira limi TaxID=2950023 RepID=A0ABT3LW40_9LEPT|nr:AcrB/AcrD/AcrF family protein [Leptospira limi]MCW7461944.1 AcrB/AcrD/AcrF family protein [Leptospira limi]